jgi:hypothetical protein
MSTANKTKRTPEQLETIRQAAPELLEALEGIFDFCLHNIPDMCEYGKTGKDQMRAARQAIAKARGTGQ